MHVRSTTNARQMQGRVNTEAELRQNKTAQHMKALSDAAAIMRDVGDVAQAQMLEQRAHQISKAQQSVSNSARLFLTARAIERAEHERREQEAATREDERKKELDHMFRMAKETTAAKRASAGEAAAEARKKKTEVEENAGEQKLSPRGEKLI